jgi:inosine-uridine nucleoside N-ribohydrolase
MSLLIDTDPGLGLPACDVDDALAIHALVSAGWPVAGLTVCFGNTTQERTLAVATELGERWRIQVFAGATHAGDVDTPAARALTTHPGDVLAIAPMTNVAAALSSGARFQRLILLGGTDRAWPNLRPLHTTEVNFALDEPAATLALSTATALFPMEVCRKVWFGADELGALPAWLADRCRAWLRLAPLMTGRRAFHPWDLLPAMWLVEPTLFRTERRGVRLASRPGRRGYVAYGDGDVEVAVDVDTGAFIRRWRSLVR